MMGLRRTSHADLRCHDVPLANDTRLGTEGKCFRMALPVLGRVAARAAQVSGGMGCRKDRPIERCVRHARSHRVFDGTSEFRRVVMARQLPKGDTTLYDPFTT